MLCRRSVSKAAKPKDETEINEIDTKPFSKELKKRWSYFIRKVYETDPLPVPNARERCVSSASLTSLMSLRKFFNTRSMGKVPGPP